MMEKAIKLLQQARRINNATISDSKEVDEWHRNVDLFLVSQNADDDRNERWDAPHRVEHRKFIRRLFND